MINNRQELKYYLNEDENVFKEYVKNNFKSLLFLKLTNDHIVRIHKYTIYLRKTQYYRTKSDSVIGKILYTYYTLKKNCLGNKLGFYIPASADIGAGLLIFHHGNIIINGNCKIGKHCKLHGCNCIGNTGSDSYAPKLGDNVELGFGASVIGNVNIAEGTVIGAGAVVVKNQLQPNAVLTGIPAAVRKINE